MGKLLESHRRELELALKNFDGSNLNPLKVALPENVESSEMLEILLDRMESGSDTERIGASWILFNRVSLRPWIGAQEQAKALGTLSKDAPWQALLHVLQLLPTLPLSRRDCQVMFPVVVELTRHSRPFVRAWAHNAVYVVANLEPGLRAQAERVLLQGSRRDSASVRARLRSVAQGSSWFSLDS